MPDCGKQRIEQRSRRRYHLRSRLIGLLETEHVGRFLVEVDPRNGFTLSLRLGQQVGLHVCIELSAPRLHANVGHDFAIGIRECRRAAGQAPAVGERRGVPC